ncbi:MAG: asparagine synthase (glutamine-hydrolyzing) [Hymenobacteraceae bacterium]|nr:asparagine synthase (glutamine-hydrolyzing) [Hymenobacteraceae bacterium]
MCGITGTFAFTEAGRETLGRLRKASEALRHRGPDADGVFLHGNVGLAHRRLSIIAPSAAANQPFSDEQGRYTILLNGEIFNYRKLREDLQAKGYTFRTGSDTEVVLQLYRQSGQGCLKKLRGFFVLAIYDAVEESLFLARDRFGEKPLLYYRDADRFLFGSELGALLELGVPRELDYTSLYQYLQLTYVPAPASMLKGVKKLLPGHSLYVRGGKVHDTTWYRLPFDAEKAAQNPLGYKQQQAKLRQLMDQAVEERMVADVPVGALLSGGIDSSVVAALASRHYPKLKTFSVGYKDQAFFDETRYAQLVAEKYKTDHTALYLTTQDLLQSLAGMLEGLSEPFADSSALAVYSIAKLAGQQVKAVLSGDGADELFAGYNKHLAEYKVQKGGLGAGVVKQFKPLWDVLPKSRNSFAANKVRQLQRFAEGASLTPHARYWLWASWQREEEARAMLGPEKHTMAVNRLYSARKSRLLECLGSNHYDLNSVLCADWHLVLANDMLPKVDLMGMANGLEVRSPYLDHRVVKFAFSLPVSSKINAGMRKRILQDTFRDVLPPELYNRPKQGFEIPLQAFLQKEGQALVQELLADDFVAAQGLFNVQRVRELRQRVTSGKSPQAAVPVWTLLVFQYWWRKYLA